LNRIQINKFEEIKLNEEVQQLKERLQELEQMDPDEDKRKVGQMKMKEASKYQEIASLLTIDLLKMNGLSLNKQRPLIRKIINC
jgi:hypothetical protein